MGLTPRQAVLGRQHAPRVYSPQHTPATTQTQHTNSTATTPQGETPTNSAPPSQLSQSKCRDHTSKNGTQPPTPHTATPPCHPPACCPALPGHNSQQSSTSPNPPPIGRKPPAAGSGTSEDPAMDPGPPRSKGTPHLSRGPTEPGCPGPAKQPPRVQFLDQAQAPLENLPDHAFHAFHAKTSSLDPKSSSSWQQLNSLPPASTERTLSTLPRVAPPDSVLKKKHQI
ncbi:protodermal factor 1-like [Girardinichthys multiradiatus]|uniref:protodermal factor 1-like n=1 Tax=Girardinichthys multiradiatus TaxID=208333 RepID=UPI001FAE0E81|nr:protodermal factor 1-like [Girardinichthys multiradiatus]